MIDWGDGNTQTINANPSAVTHVYATAGSYAISATATDEDGSYTVGRSLIVNAPASQSRTWVGPGERRELVRPRELERRRRP